MCGLGGKENGDWAVGHTVMEFVVSLLMTP
jgi:hypothetical protein